MSIVHTSPPLQFKLIIVVYECVVHLVPSRVLKECQGEVAEHSIITVHREGIVCLSLTVPCYNLSIIV